MQEPTLRWRIAVALLATVALGYCIAVVKGQSDGLRDAIGNLSGPWLLVAFWCGSLVRSRAAGAVLGVAGTMLALSGFCIGLAVISDYGSSGASTVVHLAFRANARYFEAGTVSGPLLGMAGAACARRAIPRVLFTGVVLVAEACGVAVLHRSRVFSDLTGYWSSSRSTAYVIEGAVGSLVILVALTARRRRTSMIR